MEKRKRGRPKKVVDPVIPQESDMYAAKIRVMGKWFSAEGATLEEAVLNLKPTIKKGVGLLTVTHGEKQITKVVGGTLVSKLFGTTSRVTHEVALKNLKTLFTL